jgi:wyosine [tRNA(Phe)-imidazoG37] synthetase (radical SAM superfamily)
MTTNIEQTRFSHVFGPIHSRRLGLSLGVDLVPFKTCTFDCVYCQLGRTINKTLCRKEYVPVNDVLSELECTLKKGPRPDFITISGSGEPTLHSGLKDIIMGIRAITSLPVAVLTNGSLFNDKDVREACSLADVVLPSLDAGDEETFNTVNRPVQGLTFQTLIDGLKAFWLDYGGQIWLEMLLVGSVTDNDSAVEKIAHLAESFRPDWIHLNTAIRPAAEEFVQPVSVSNMKRFAGVFNPKAQCIFAPPSRHAEQRYPVEKLQETLKRRPCTMEEMARLLNIPQIEITKYIGGMRSRGQLMVIRRGKDTYYAAAPGVWPEDLPLQSGHSDC